MEENKKIESIRSFMRSCNHWLRLLPDEIEMFVRAAFWGSMMEEEHCVLKLGQIFTEKSPHDLAMVAKEAFSGFYYKENLSNKKDARKHRLNKIWNDSSEGSGDLRHLSCIRLYERVKHLN